jgi:hypothetical protein
VRRRTPVREAEHIVGQVRRRQYLLDLLLLLAMLAFCVAFWFGVGYLIWLLVTCGL